MTPSEQRYRNTVLAVIYMELTKRIKKLIDEFDGGVAAPVSVSVTMDRDKNILVSIKPIGGYMFRRSFSPSAKMDEIVDSVDEAYLAYGRRF